MKKKYLVVILLLMLVVVSGVSMPNAKANSETVYMAGAFYGKYFYDNGSSSKFEGMLYQDNEKIWGECVDQDGSSSSITGEVNGNRIDFIKTYYHDNHQVQYTGNLIPETNAVKGHWRIDQNNIGSFTMTIRGNKM